MANDRYLLNQINAISKAAGIEKISVISPRPFNRLEGLLTSTQKAGLNGDSLKRKIDPLHTMEDCKSIIVALFPYHIPGITPWENKNKGTVYSGDFYFRQDYHYFIKGKLKAMMAEVCQIMPCNYTVFTDTGPLVDRELVLRSGMGQYGKNHCMIVQGMGSLFYIGYVLTDLPLSFTENNQDADLCASCQKCVKACPAGAIVDQRRFHANLCISKITQQKGILSKMEMRLMGNSLYGCYRCQQCCPYNQSYLSGEFLELDLAQMLELSNKQMQTLVQDTGAGWIGKKILIRNALIVMGNSKNKRFIEILRNFTEHRDQNIRTTAENALEILEEDLL